MKKYCYRITGTIYWFRVDGGTTYYKTKDIDWNNSNQSFIKEILEDRHPTLWLKMSINHYYNICK